MFLQDLKFTITHGNGKAHRKWINRKTYDWSSLTKLLSTHKRGPKDGSCYTIATFTGNKRKKAEAMQIDIAVLDCDTGEPYEYVKAAIKKQGFAAVIASTHSHMSTTTEVKRGPFEKANLSPEQYLIDDKGMRSEIVQNAVVSKKLETTIIIEHGPCPKFRIIIPLKMPWKASNYPSQEEACKDWGNRLFALADLLGLKHDKSCRDPSRLYFLPRYRKDAPTVSQVLEGDPCDLFAISVNEDKPCNLTYNTTNKIKASFKFTDPKTNQSVNLVKWAKEYDHDFKIADVLKQKKLEMFVGYDNDNKAHIICPNGDKHTSTDIDTATFVCNPEHSPNKGFVIHCLHNHCKDHDRLFFIQKMLEDGWLSIADLYDEGDPPKTYGEILEIIAGFSQLTSPDDIEDILTEIKRADLGHTHCEMLFQSMKTATGITLTTLRKAFRKAGEKNGDDGGMHDLAYNVMLITLKKFFGNGRLLFRAQDGCFWGYNGKHWQIILDEQMHHYILKIVELINPEGFNFSVVKNHAFNLLVGHRAIQNDFFNLANEPKPVINVQNGEIWIDEHGRPELKKHNPGSYLKNVLDIYYDSDAKCPRFEQALLETFSESTEPSEMVRHIEETMGYIIQPHRFHACWLMWIGGGSNGKTKLFQTLEKLLGKWNIYADRISALSSNRFALGHLSNKLLFVDDDVATNTLLDDGMLKKVSEGKALTGEVKYKDPFEFQSRAAILMLANNYPLTVDLTHGMLRRARIMPFDREFGPTDSDNSLFPYIWKNELSGVLNRLLAGLQRLIARGDFLEPEDCQNAKRIWLKHSNPLMAFLDERCKNNSEARVPLKNFYNAFRDWCAESGINRMQTKQTVHKNLQSLGFKSKTHNGSPSIIGLALIGSHFSTDDNK